MHFLRKGVPNLQKVGAEKNCDPPISATKIYPPPHHRYTLPPKQAKTVLKAVFLKQNKYTICGHLVTLYILVIKNFMIPPFFFPKFYDPLVYLGRKMPAPWKLTRMMWGGGTCKNLYTATNSFNHKAVNANLTLC